MSLKDLLEMEESFWKSAGDEEFYRESFADEGMIVLSMGVMDKQGVVASMSDAEPWESFEIEDPSLVPIDDGVAGIVYKATGHRDVNSGAYEANILSVYRRRGEGWQLVLHQQTPVEG